MRGQSFTAREGNRDFLCEVMREIPDGHQIIVREPTRNKEQNARLWAMLTDIVRAQPEGRRWTAETWKCAFMHALGWQVQFCEALDGGSPFPVGFRSSRLTVKQCSDLIETVREYGDRHGVVWSEPNPYERGYRSAS